MALAAAWFLLAGGSAASAQSSADPLPRDTYRDAPVRRLLERARTVRGQDLAELNSYEGTLRERIYVGLTALRFRRERALFEQERVARLRWSADGERAIQWLGARRAIPVVGADTRRAAMQAVSPEGARAEVASELRDELPDELLSEMDLPSFAFDPAGDRLVFGQEWFLHPLADSALANYRYASGDTLTLRLPDRDLVLFEVRVEPRAADFHLMAGSLWFDAETAALVRATYRPARPFDLALDEPEDAQDVPGFLQPVEAEIRYITVEYSLQEFRYWLPRRFAMEGEARLGRLVRIPLTVEWTVRDLAVNEAPSAPLAGPLPRGWSRREGRVTGPDGEPRYVTVLVPRPDSLLTSSLLSEESTAREPSAFTDQELADLQRDLEALLPTYGRLRPSLRWGITRGLTRYNRVEGLSVGAEAAMPLSPSMAVRVRARIGTGDRVPGGTFTLTRGAERARWTLEAYRELRSMNDWDDPFSLTSSAGSLLLGTGHGEFYRGTGATLGYGREGGSVRWRASAFYEAQRPVERSTSFFLLDPVRDHAVDTVLRAEAATLGGVRADVRWFHGLDPMGWIVTGELRGEAGWGDVRYQRLAASASVSHPLFAGLAGAVELGGATVWGSPPLQRTFFLGGSSTLRGFDTNAVRGGTVWRARAEVAGGFPGARIGAFTDAGWAGDRTRLRLEDALVSAGVGASLLDGLIRADLARAVRGGSGWKVHLYLDGLF